jgi:glycosyltransferase involved in cell wall biosynthesis
MKYSFVIIAYNEEPGIQTCIKFILAQQRLGEDYEILVVDDGSKDNTAGKVGELSKENNRIKLVGDGQNHGRGYGRKKGVENAGGEYIIMIDADITLPRHWLVTCLDYIKDYDVVGGTAVPDGDVAYVHGLLGLKPKVAQHTTTITGSNGMFRRAVFDSISFDKHLREGEDVDFNHKFFAKGFRGMNIHDLLVEHQESKSFITSVKWLFQSGIGATRQLLCFREVRMPDLAAGGFVGVVSMAAVAMVCLNLSWLLALLLIVGYVSAGSLAHLYGKFELLKTPLKSCLAIAVNDVLMTSYYFGRLFGFIKFFKKVE